MTVYVVDYFLSTYLLEKTDIFYDVFSKVYKNI